MKTTEAYFAYAEEVFRKKAQQIRALERTPSLWLRIRGSWYK